MKVSKCHNCDQKGHWSRECPHPPRDKSKKDRALAGYTFDGCSFPVILGEQLGLLRACREDFSYGARTVLGKSIYWVPSFAYLMNLLSSCGRGKHWGTRPLQTRPSRLGFVSWTNAWCSRALSSTRRWMSRCL